MKCKVVVFLFLLLLAVVSCRPVTISSPLPTPPVSLPIWPKVNLGDPVESLGLDSNQTLEVHLVTIYEKPLFYNGTIPFGFKALKLPRKPPQSPIPVIYIFDDWITLFSYDDNISGIASRAVTYDKIDGLLAEAIFEEVAKDGSVIILEIHYNKRGEVTFWCRSRMSFGIGLREEEFDAHGVKEQDYYFIWPITY